jgi:hypothetical protein
MLPSHFHILKRQIIKALPIIIRPLPHIGELHLSGVSANTRAKNFGAAYGRVSLVCLKIIEEKVGVDKRGYWCLSRSSSRVALKRGSA